MWVVTRCGGAGCYAFDLLWCARWRCVDEMHYTVIDELMLLTIYHSDLCVWDVYGDAIVVPVCSLLINEYYAKSLS